MGQKEIRSKGTQFNPKMKEYTACKEADKVWKIITIIIIIIIIVIVITVRIMKKRLSSKKRYIKLEEERYENWKETRRKLKNIVKRRNKGAKKKEI